METKIIFFTTLLSIAGFTLFKPNRSDLTNKKTEYDTTYAERYLDSLKRENIMFVDSLIGLNNDTINYGK